MKINWRWPAGPRRPDYVPWYVIGWRAMWVPLFIGGKLLSAGAIWASTLSWSEAADCFNSGY